jgi:hypothetical protein
MLRQAAVGRRPQSSTEPDPPLSRIAGEGEPPSFATENNAFAAPSRAGTRRLRFGFPCAPLPRSRESAGVFGTIAGSGYQVSATADWLAVVGVWGEPVSGRGIPVEQGNYRESNRIRGHRVGSRTGARPVPGHRRRDFPGALEQGTKAQRAGNLPTGEGRPAAQGRRSASRDIQARASGVRLEVSHRDRPFGAELEREAAPDPAGMWQSRPSAVGLAVGARCVGLAPRIPGAGTRGRSSGNG